MRLSSSAGAAAEEAAGAALALGSTSALLWEAWAAFALGTRFLGTAAAAPEPLHATSALVSAMPNEGPLWSDAAPGPSDDVASECGLLPYSPSRVQSNQLLC